jgi:predicted amidohydrolase YtcJ
MSFLALRQARLWDRGGRWRIVLRNGEITAIEPESGRRASPSALDIHGNILVPGFHDAHMHVLATARARSVRRLAPGLRGRTALAAALRSHAAGLGPHDWLRVAGLDPCTMLGGWTPDRYWLDSVLGDRQVRLQHRNLRCDVLSTYGLHRCGLMNGGDGVELGEDQRPTGRIHGAGHSIRDREADLHPAELRRLVAALSAEMLASGVTAVQDAGEANGDEELDLLDTLATEGVLRQRLWTMASGRALVDNAVVTTGRPRVVHAKLVAREAQPDPDGLIAQAHAARRRGLGVAIHATSEAELALAVAVIEAAQADDDSAAPPGTYRVEHAFVASDALVQAVADTGATVVACPALVALHGDEYLDLQDEHEASRLHRLAAWPRAGVPLVLSSDAPVTPPALPLALVAATSRRTPSGRVLGNAEALGIGSALAAITEMPARLVGAARRLGRVEVGATADLVALRPRSGLQEVTLTILAGDVVHRAL